MIAVKLMVWEPERILGECNCQVGPKIQVLMIVRAIAADEDAALLVLKAHSDVEWAELDGKVAPLG